MRTRGIPHYKFSLTNRTVGCGPTVCFPSFFFHRIRVVGLLSSVHKKSKMVFDSKIHLKGTHAFHYQRVPL